MTPTIYKTQERLYPSTFLQSRPCGYTGECPILHAGDAFNNIPEDDLSDAEPDEPPPVVLVPVRRIPAFELLVTKLHQVLRLIFDGVAPLPSEIKVLRFNWGEDRSATFSVMEQQEAVARLSHLYPQLREVRLGYSDSVWNREGAVWRKCGTNSRMQVVSVQPGVSHVS
ncbi:hypothetical protein C8R45DRAFT_920346 [Mycena sanguinolenta]|nr:hypothetical protein C8R45DRAFT_920346 [Mycena sanguinolenta]